MENDEADYLLISGLRHFAYCRRRWALVHIEQQWSENALTMDGHFMHERVHDSGFTEKTGQASAFARHGREIECPRNHRSVRYGGA